MKAATTKAGRTERGTTEAATNVAPAEVTRCPHTAELAGFISDDAICLIELVTDMIGEAVEYTNEMACARVMLARMGMVAQMIRDAHRTDGHRGGWHAEAVHWVLLAGGSDDNAPAWEALRRRAAP